MALRQTLLQSPQVFKLVSASASSKQEVYGLLNKGPCLLTAKFQVLGKDYQFIIDTGATVSFVPEQGLILSSGHHKLINTNLSVTLADDSTAFVDKKVNLAIRPKGSSSYHTVPFYVHRNSNKILGYDALLGLDHLKLF